jgi:hypothetical protein
MLVGGDERYVILERLECGEKLFRVVEDVDTDEKMGGVLIILLEELIKLVRAL